MNAKKAQQVGMNFIFDISAFWTDLPSKLQNLLLSETNNNVNKILPSICQLVFSFSLNTHT